MKKLIAIFGVIAFTAGMAFAQNNDASIDQTGDNHEAVIEQIGLSNKAYVVQTQNNDNFHAEADIMQHGDFNFVNLNQSSHWGVNTEANIEQIGNNNRVSGDLDDDSEFLLQNNAGGLLDVKMVGNNNSLYSLVGEAQKNRNEFILTIEGDDNTVGMHQEFGFAYADIDGSNNDLTIWQSAGANWDESKFNVVNVDILGDFNTVDISQQNISNNAKVDIDGSFNTATITQSAY